MPLSASLRSHRDLRGFLSFSHTARCLLRTPTRAHGALTAPPTWLWFQGTQSEDVSPGWGRLQQGACPPPDPASRASADRLGWDRGTVPERTGMGRAKAETPDSHPLRRKRAPLPSGGSDQPPAPGPTPKPARRGPEAAPQPLSRHRWAGCPGWGFWAPTPSGAGNRVTEDSAHSRKSTLCSGHRDSAPTWAPASLGNPRAPAGPPCPSTHRSRSWLYAPRPRTPVPQRLLPARPRLRNSHPQARALPHVTFSGPPSLPRPGTQTRGDKRVS